ncbi:MAG: hypothetical protein QGH04_06695, partial [Candidatus Marinimicrobia bacterium]|nr:hypothetical protein [Candidatus Neomarinimicrobiota bacterium]
KKKLELDYLNEYFSSIESLEKKYNFISVCPESNIIDLINSCDLTISIPYTSPTNIAYTLGKKSIFYDPTGRLVGTKFHPKDLEITRSKEAKKQ